MKNTSLCYIEKDGKYLMLFRNEKANDPNEGKWLGIGGKFEKGESPEECVSREVFEETGLILKQKSFRGIVTFDNDKYETEYMFVFTSNDFNGNIVKKCNEGTLKWINKQDILSLPLWEGDKYFLELLAKDAPFFSLKLTYSGDKLLKAFLNGEELSKN